MQRNDEQSVNCVLYCSKCCSLIISFIFQLVVVTALVKYSHSSVDVLSCFASVIEEWRKIDVHDPDCASLGVTKVTDVSNSSSKILTFIS